MQQKESKSLIFIIVGVHIQNFNICLTLVNNHFINTLQKSYKNSLKKILKKPCGN